MIISKDKNIIVTFDNEVTLSNQEKPNSKRAIVFDFVDPNASVKNKSDDNILYINNPGEYEFSNVLIKVSKKLNIFISMDNTKLYYVVDGQDIDEDKNASISDIFIFDNLVNGTTTSEKIVDVIKMSLPKVVVVNSSYLEDSIANAEKISKVKIKQSELDIIIDTKIYSI